MKHVLRLHRAPMSLRLIGACAVALMIARPAGAQSGDPTPNASPPQPGCPYKALTAKTQAIFGAYDRALFSGGTVAGDEIPNVVKVREVSVYTCVFQRAKTRETLQIIANSYPNPAEALDAFHEASRVKNAAGPFYTSRQDGNLQVFEGPGRSLSYSDNMVMIVHWMVVEGGKVVPSSKPGSTLTPLAEVLLASISKK